MFSRYWGGRCYPTLRTGLGLASDCELRTAIPSSICSSKAKASDLRYREKVSAGANLASLRYLPAGIKTKIHSDSNVML